MDFKLYGNTFFTRMQRKGKAVRNFLMKPPNQNILVKKDQVVIEIDQRHRIEAWQSTKKILRVTIQYIHQNQKSQKHEKRMIKFRKTITENQIVDLIRHQRVYLLVGKTNQMLLLDLLIEGHLRQIFRRSRNILRRLKVAYPRTQKYQ